MPKRIHAIDDETLRREAGQLADDVLLLPQQVPALPAAINACPERISILPSLC